jgi:hypothetical protein
MKRSPENPERPGEAMENESAILTPSEIGALSPRVPRRSEMLREAPKPIEAKILDENGDEIVYLPESISSFSPDTRLVQKGDRAKRPFTFKGKTKDGKVVLETEDGEGITIALRELETSYERSKQIYSERTKEGKEVSLDTEAVLKESVGFYAAHDIKDFLKELPKEIRLSSQSEARLREALREGFDKAMLLPKTEVQSANIETIASETAIKEIPNLPTNEQYTSPYFESGTKAAQARNRPKQKAYLLLYQSGPIPGETKGKSPDQIDPLFAQKKWSGFTIEEYLLTQRKEAESRKDHSFDAYDGDAKKSQWTWLLDSRVPRGVVLAYWSPGSRRVSVRWVESGGSCGRLGARPAVVVEIEV